MVKCLYAGHDENGNPVYCDKDADVVVRLEGQMPARKTPVCREHSVYLRTSDDVELNWEQCGEDPSAFASNSERGADG